MTDNTEDKVVNPLENSEKLFLQLVEFLLINLKIIVVVLGLLFLIVLLVLMVFFNIFGF